ncbi:MAG: response regulator transcription factor [Burkholderiales bacterium]|nr:response regulator transcription factor [Burkholderiales bacterium]
MPTVFLVDDDASVRRSLSRVLREAGFDIETYESAEAFLAQPGAPSSGCLVLDVTMPGLDGLALQKHMAEAGNALPVVFLTGHGDIPMSVRAMKAGASDFLTKPVTSQALVVAVRAALAQDAAARQARTETAELAQLYELLTPREREVLAAVTCGKLNKQIAFDLGVVEQTVKFHRARIMERMHARTVAELMHMAAKLGIASSAAAAPVQGRPAGSAEPSRKA